MYGFRNNMHLPVAYKSDPHYIVNHELHTALGYCV